MPKVGKKHFSYTKEGMRAAEAEARRTGKPIVIIRRPTPVARTRKTKKA